MEAHLDSAGASISRPGAPSLQIWQGECLATLLNPPKLQVARRHHPRSAPKAPTGSNCSARPLSPASLHPRGGNKNIPWREPVVIRS